MLREVRPRSFRRYFWGLYTRATTETHVYCSWLWGLYFSVTDNRVADVLEELERARRGQLPNLSRRMPITNAATTALITYAHAPPIVVALARDAALPGAQPGPDHATPGNEDLDT